MNVKKTTLATGMALALGTPAAHAVLIEDIFGAGFPLWITDSANFTMLNSAAAVTGGTNDVVMLWDGNAYSDSSDYDGVGSASNVTASSTTPFEANVWTAHDIQVFVPGSYSFDTTLDGGNDESGIMNVTVATGQIGMHMLFDWGDSDNIDVFVVAESGTVYGAGTGKFAAGDTALGFAEKCVSTTAADRITNCGWDGLAFGTDGQPDFSNPWMLATVDGDGDSIMGIPMMPGGPFGGFNAGFNANLTGVPIPAAVWLFGSGLLGLVGVARRKKSS